MKNKYSDIIKLFITNNETKHIDEVGTLNLILGGIIGSKYFKKENREILITSLNSYELALKNNIQIKHGALGENILTNMDLKNLQIGTQLQIGTAIVEISLLCPVCTHLSMIKKELPELIKNNRGIFAKVIKDGQIKIGDKIEVI